MAALPATIDISEKALGPHLRQADLETAQALSGKVPTMQSILDSKVPVTRMQAESAVEWMKDAARIRDIIWKGDTPDVQKAYELHRSLTAKRANKVRFFDGVVDLCKAITGRREIEQRRKAEAEQRERERIAREQAEAERKAQADALLAEAAATGDETLVAEAIRVEQTPITPTLLPVVEAAKLDGVSVRLAKYGTVVDAGTLIRFLAETQRADLITELIEWKEGGINAAIRRGVELPGVSIEERPITTRLR